MNVVENIKETLRQGLREALTAAKAAGELEFEAIPNLVLEVPREKAHGDFATNIAMIMSKQVGKPPRQVAEILLAHLPRQGTWIREVQIAGPGFINFHLDHGWIYQVLPAVEEEDKEYGRSNTGGGKKVQVEFVSANPTGLLHMGNARGAALGDTLASLLQAAGYEVTREFYINDAGNQIENFAKSLEARYLQLLGQDVPFPEEGYHGEDITATMRGLVEKEGDRYLSMDPEERRQLLAQYALKEKLEAIATALRNFGVEYDVWFSEQSLHDSGAVQATIEELQKKGYIYENEGALWFKATAFGEEKDEVVVRSNGTPTYFAADIAYHKNKFDRGFQWVINIWGADHHGHVSRMKGAVKATGYDPDSLQVILMQLVRLFRGGEIIRMSKRTGQYITLEELMEEVGKDAARFFFVMRSADSHLDFDLDLAKSQSAENPVYYVQYAHARICSILRTTAQKLGAQLPHLSPELREALTREEDATADYLRALSQAGIYRPAATVDLSCLQEGAELELIRKIADLPGEIAAAAKDMEPHRIARYATDLAALFHAFYNSCRVLTEDEALRQARLVLVNASRITLRNVLTLLGISAPEKM